MQRCFFSIAVLTAFGCLSCQQLLSIHPLDVDSDAGADAAGSGGVTRGGSGGVGATPATVDAATSPDADDVVNSNTWRQSLPPTGPEPQGVLLGGTGIGAVNAVAVDNLGNIIVAGAFEKSIGVGPVSVSASAGGQDIFVAKLALDKNGKFNVVWLRNFGGGQHTAEAIAVDAAGNVLVGGRFYKDVNFSPTLKFFTDAGTDAFLTKLNAGDGTAQWAVRYGGPGDDTISGITMASNGTTETDAFVVGTFTGTQTFSAQSKLTAQGRDMFVMRIDTTAATVKWAESIGGANNDWSAAVARSSSGGLVVAGTFLGQLSTTVKDDSQHANNCLVHSSGRDASSALVSNALLVELSGDLGRCRWSYQFGGTSAAAATALTVDDKGAAYLGGTILVGPPVAMAANLDGFVSKVLVGSEVWNFGFGGLSDDDAVGGLAMSGTGEVLLAGTISGKAVFGPRKWELRPIDEPSAGNIRKDNMIFAVMNAVDGQPKLLHQFNSDTTGSAVASGSTGTYVAVNLCGPALVGTLTLTSMAACGPLLLRF